MPRLDARHVFQAVNALDGLLAAGAAGHAVAPVPALAAIAASQAALTAACIGGIFVLYFFGAKLRARSRFSAK